MVSTPASVDKFTARFHASPDPGNPNTLNPRRLRMQPKEQPPLRLPHGNRSLASTHAPELCKTNRAAASALVWHQVLSIATVLPQLHPTDATGRCFFFQDCALATINNSGSRTTMTIPVPHTALGRTFGQRDSFQQKSSGEGVLHGSSDTKINPHRIQGLLNVSDSTY